MLMVFIVLQHIGRQYFEVKSFITIALNTVVLVLTILYFYQLQTNLSNYFLIDNIKKQTVIISITYPIVYFATPAFQFLRNGKAMKDLDTPDKVLSIIILLLATVALVLQIIQYLILAKKLVSYKFNKQVRLLGYLNYLFVISCVGIFTFMLVRALRPYLHIFIICELLPLWVVYTIYRKIIKDGNGVKTNEVV
jgi:hypothetical protein